MKQELITTADGSSSLYIPELDETYHSTHGALKEALHVFIENGLKRREHASVKIFESRRGANYILCTRTIQKKSKTIRF